MSEENSQELLVRIVNVDYYLSKPISNLNDPCYSGFRSLPISYVPIIRIFGPTSAGVKTCIHIHGVFPYIFVPNWNSSVDEKDLYQFAVILDKAINTSFANSTAKTCHVYRITSVLGRPFYGFYEDEKQFLKIEFFNPAIVKRAADLLQNGAVLNTSFQPYEAHVPYILQFFIDNNLYGMNYIALSSHKLRCSEENADELKSYPNVTKQSYCALEIDANVDDIVDMNQNKESKPTNPGLAFIWEEEKRRRRILNEPSQITLTLSQDRPTRLPTKTESYFRDKMAAKLSPYKEANTLPPDSLIEASQSSATEYTELNTQSRSVLSLLEKLMEEKETNKPCSSASSSPSVVYSDNEEEIPVESSQPVLKLQAENDSILGFHFSDNEMDEIDDNDHNELSQSFVRTHYEKLLSSDDSDVGSYDHVPQLDGATSPNLSRRRASKTGSGSKRTYNLRSKNSHSSASDLDGNRHSRISDIIYPQLQIDTQKSPKCANRTSSATESSIPTTSPSTSTHFIEPHSRLCPIDDSQRSDFRRPYPQLEINIKKSPRSVPVGEKPKPTSRLRKRKLNFIENTSTSDGSFDMSSVTVKWKKRLKPATPTINEFSDSLPMDTDINSQKYSLKIQFNAEELEEKKYSDMLLKKPAILLKRVNLHSITKEPKSLSPSECLITGQVCDTVQKNEHQNSRMEVEMCGSFRQTENLQSNDELMPKVIHRKRLGMRMRGQKYVKDQLVDFADLSQNEKVKSFATDEACQNKSTTSNDNIEDNARVEQSDTSAENPDYSLFSEPKVTGVCDVSIDLNKINALDSGKSEVTPESDAKYNKNSPRSHGVNDSNKQFQFKDSSDQSNAISTRKIRLCDASRNVGNLNMSEYRRVRKLKVTGARRNSKVVQSKIPQPVNAVEQCSDDRKKTLVLTNEDYAKNFKLKDVSVHLKPINIDRFFSHNGSAEINGTEKLPSLANVRKTETEKNSESRVTSNNMDFFYPNESCWKEFNALDSNFATEAICTSADGLSTNVANVSKSCFSDSDDDLVMVISEDESHSGIISSGSTSNVTYTPVFPNSDTLNETGENLVDDEEIDRIALSIINQTAAAFNLTTDETIKFTEISNIEEVPSTQELSYGNKVIESGSAGIDKPVEHCVNQNNAEDSTNVENMKYFVCDDDELVLSDDDTKFEIPIAIPGEETTNSLKATVNNRPVIDETIKFTELEFEDALNDVELGNIEIRLDKSIESEVSPGPTNEDLKIDLEMNEHLSKPTKSPTSKMISSDRQEFSVNIDENDFNDSQSVPHISPECQGLSDKNSVEPATAEEHIFCTQRSGRAVKSLRWALDEFNSVSSGSRHLQQSRSESPEKADIKRSSPLSVSLFTSAGNQSNIQSPIADHFLNRPQTQELFSPVSPRKVSQSSDDGVIQIRSNNDENTSIQPENRSLSSIKKTATPGSLDTVPGSKINYKFDNSIWYSSDEEDDDDQVCSLYQNESVSSPEVVLFPESRPDSPAGEDPVAGSNEKSSSQEANNSDGEIVSQSQSPGLQISKDLSVDNSPAGAGGARRRMLHSTPTGRRSKKSPSPTYTPIYKKLMMKVMNEEERAARREPKLDGIKEELETKAADVSSTSANNSVTKSEDAEQNKSGDSSRAVNTVGSGRIDTTMNDTYGFKIGLENLQSVKADIQFQFITVMSMELFVETRGDMNPDPEYDSISCIFYTLYHDAPNAQELKSGMIIVNTEPYQLDLLKYSCYKEFVQSEDELFNSFVNIIRQYDPDIFLGYEIEMLSWGYLIQRGQHKNRNCYEELSRVRDTRTKEFKNKSVVEDGDYSNDLKLVGRIVLNVWRLMRHEMALQSYTFENILFHIMHQRAPQYSFQSLTQWWKNSLQRWMVIEYYLFRAENNILILQQLDFFGRTSELAKLFGIQFYEVLSRGSQFRVESMMLRLAKTQNFVAMSPNPRQRAAMRAPECLPLIMEPKSKYYREPVIVLDFQSLYPSIIIAYNYCFSTCLGRVQHLVNNETFEFGCGQHTVPIDLLLKLEPSLNISPCGVAFVNRDVRRGILPAMLEEILETRLMVKKSMKQNKNNSVLQRVLHARQLGLKLIANVTYGYTSANFSGRMPCIEVGDSVVSKGRETLQRAIEQISANEKWQAEVIYGDTDSIFVMVPGRSKEEAFRIGTEIVNAVTNDNPKPVKLKLEKVYYPCILQTKKRYVGYMYESADQKEPVYDAKGIETVRRDGCPAVAKILEKCLKLLFETNNVDTAKHYAQRQFSKIISGRISIQELTFAREYRGMANYKPAACVPALQLARQALTKDRRAEPRVKERVRYVLIAGPPNVPLIRLVRTPEQFLSCPGSLINAEYYITRAIIPALERCFGLMNVNVQNWYAELPRKKQFLLPVQNDLQNRQQKKKTAIFQYFASSKCISCGEVTVSSVCKQCEQQPRQLAIVLGNLINSWQRKHNYISKICRSCSFCPKTSECLSLDCPVYYTRCQATRDVEQVPFVEELQHKHLRLVIGTQAKENQYRK